LWLSNSSSNSDSKSEVFNSAKRAEFAIEVDRDASIKQTPAQLAANSAAQIDMIDQNNASSPALDVPSN